MKKVDKELIKIGKEIAEYQSKSPIYNGEMVDKLFPVIKVKENFKKK